MSLPSGLLPGGGMKTAVQSSEACCLRNVNFSLDRGLGLRLGKAWTSTKVRWSFPKESVVLHLGADFTDYQIGLEVLYL